MATWKVIKGRAEVFPHPNADKLEIVKVDKFQAIAQKGLYQNGDEVIFAPEKSILPDILAEGFRNYLKGPEANRVGSIKLRGEVSMGVIIPMDTAADYLVKMRPQLDEPLYQAHYELGEVEYGEDISDFLDIYKYEPPVPTSLSGQVDKLPYGYYTHHDVEGFHSYADEFDEEEFCIVTEKLHGSQGIFILNNGQRIVSSKGLFKRDLMLNESENNTYWRAAYNSGIFELAEKLRDYYTLEAPPSQVAIYGEVIPVQGGNWTYGLNPQKPEVRIFEVRIDAMTISYPFDEELRELFGNLWVPVIHSEIPFSEIQVQEVRKGKELVSGQQLHIREGVVIRPQRPRLASDGTRLLIKAINPKYKETGEEFS